jgi:L-threonylcarbamoyladenylate synthase
MNVFDLTRGLPEEALSAAERALEGGELVVFPTDTVYGVAARPDISGATLKLFEAKRRPRDLTLPVLNAGLREAESVAAFDGRARLLATRFWPGGLTMVLPRRPPARAWYLGQERETVGVRVPAHDIALALLKRTGPLAVTSANLSGEPTPADCRGVRTTLGEAVAVYLCAGPRSGRPSTVVDLTGSEPIIRREGDVAAAVIRTALAAEEVRRRR